jgi:hypothetical protein
LVAIKTASPWTIATDGLARWLTRRRLFWVVLVAAVLVYAQSHFWNMPSVGDRANWDYIAQVIARGGVPYRDVVNIKSPLSAYIGAAAIVVTRPFGVRDIYAIRWMFILLAALTVAFTFLVTFDYFGDRNTALLAAAMLLGISAFLRLNGQGAQPKTPMVLFGLMTLWAVIKDRPFAAGVFGMLSALSWQPGLLFVGAAGLAFSRYLTSWRDKKVLRLLAGAGIPLAAQIIYFWAAGTLRDFYLWNIDFNATIYGPRGVRTLSSFLHRIQKMLAGTYHGGRFYFYLSLPGLLVALGLEWLDVKRHGARRLLDNAPRHAIIIAPVVYFLFCMVDIQGGADLIPLLPFVATFAALAIAYLCKGAVALLTRKWTTLDREWLAANGLVIAILLVMMPTIGYAVFGPRDHGLQAQDTEVAQIVSYLQPGDQIYAHGQAEILVLSGLTNASKYYLLDRGKDEYLDRILDGGFTGWLQTLKDASPKIVALGRIKTLLHRKEFVDWVRADYVKRKGKFFTYYIRKDAAGDLPPATGDDDADEDTQTTDEY